MCEYTRTGYSDPCQVFRIPTTTSVAEIASAKHHQPQDMHIESLARVLPTPLDDTPATGQRDVLDFSHLNFNTPFDHMTASALPGLGWAGMNSGFEDLDWDSLFTFPEWPDTITQANSAPAILPNSLQTRSDPKESSWDLVEESPLREVDRVEAKCAEIQSYIRGSKTGVDLAVLSNYITRDRLVDCVELYTKGYQSVQPILHLPTFDLTKTPPDLLGAMMLVGACYSSTLIPATVVVQGAIHMLLVSEHSSVSGFCYSWETSIDRSVLARDGNDGTSIDVHTGQCSPVSAPHPDPQSPSILFRHNAPSSHHLSTFNTEYPLGISV